MTHYLALHPQQEPFDLNELDDSGRIQYSVNFLAMKKPSSTFLREVVAALVTAGVGIEGQTIFASSLATLPRSGTVLHLRATPGTAPLGTHDEGAGSVRQPGLQIIVRSPTEAGAASMAEAAYAALVAVRNQEIPA